MSHKKEPQKGTNEAHKRHKNGLVSENTVFIPFFLCVLCLFVAN